MILVQEKEKQTRGEVQYKGVEYAKINNYICYQYPTSLGKTWTIIQVLEELWRHDKNIKILILMPEIALIENIKKEFIKFSKEYLLNNIDIYCYASLHKVEDKYKVLVCDELHHSLSDLRKEELSRLKKIERFLGASATIDDWKIRELESIFRKEIFVHRVTLKDAIDWGILATPTVCCFRLKLDNLKKDYTYEFLRGKKENRVEIILEKEIDKWKYIKDKKNYPNLKIIIKCTQKQKHDYLEQQADYFEQQYLSDLSYKNSEYKKNRWLQAELNIKRFLAEIKTPIVNKFLKDLKDKRYIIFANSIKQAQELAKENNGNVVSSEEKDSEKIIESFLEYKINNLYAISKLQEGINLDKIELVVMVQLGGQKREFIQKIGRALRNEENPEVYLFYYEGTKDEEYLNKVINNISKDYILLSDYFYN